MATAPLHSGQVDCLVSLVNTALFTTNVFLVPPVYLSRIDSICSILTSPFVTNRRRDLGLTSKLRGMG